MCRHLRDRGGKTAIQEMIGGWPPRRTKRA
jgi:hypothetical protein